jgi:hypothetical protein
MARIAQPSNDSHEHEGFSLPSVTTPQGTQENGVLKGHEEKDINFRSVINWFVLLAIITIVSQVALAFGYKYLIRFSIQKDQPPSQMFAERKAPPQPRLLPNPVDSQKLPSYTPITTLGPGPVGETERSKEMSEAAGLGLWDAKTGTPELPASAVQSLRRRGALASLPGGADSTQTVSDGSKQLMPTYSSGGLTMEDRLR